mmetsp:Transcript_6358/g.13891  ORF Transcript_6358/g.13891 Transcript_6358/m.13891 type:complete len:243 (-) Transcript_6358:961-1689(-)
MVHLEGAKPCALFVEVVTSNLGDSVQKLATNLHTRRQSYLKLLQELIPSLLGNELGNSTSFFAWQLRNDHHSHPVLLSNLLAEHLHHLLKVSEAHHTILLLLGLIIFVVILVSTLIQNAGALLGCAVARLWPDVFLSALQVIARVRLLSRTISMLLAVKDATVSSAAGISLTQASHAGLISLIIQGLLRHGDKEDHLACRHSLQLLNRMPLSGWILQVHKQFHYRVYLADKGQIRVRRVTHQ